MMRPWLAGVPPPAYNKGMFINAVQKRQECVGEEAYIDSIPAIRTLKELRLTKPVTFFAGENGSGKSTLLEAIAVAYGFNPEGGSKNFNFSTQASHSRLYDRLRLIKGVPYARDGFFLRAESFYNVSTEVDRLEREAPGESFLRSYGGKSLHEQSHGESFLALALNRFRKNGLYILDEPEAALSPSRQLTLLARFHELVQGNAQFVIATHSPLLMAYPEAEIFWLDDMGMHPISYRETEHYVITRRFLENPQRMLDILLKDT